MSAASVESFVEGWAEVVCGFLDGEPSVPDHLRPWFASYEGKGRGEVIGAACPEPWIGSFERETCRRVMLGLNPGEAHLEWQGRDGVFADEMRVLGSYSRWAATWPYLRDPWETTIGPNRYHRSRLRFLRQWMDAPQMPDAAMVVVEMYPWHSTAVTSAMRPDPGLIRHWVFEPVRALDAPVFAFGAPWLDLLPRLGLREVDRLGRGGRAFPSAVPSRTVVVYDLDGVPLIAEKHSGGAGPPSERETMILRHALVDSAPSAG